MKCIHCEYCKIIDCGMGDFTSSQAKCELKNKVILSTFTTFQTKGFSIVKSIKEYDSDRVKKKLEKMEKTPKWCPLL